MAGGEKGKKGEGRKKQAGEKIRGCRLDKEREGIRTAKEEGQRRKEGT